MMNILYNYLKEGWIDRSIDSPHVEEKGLFLCDCVHCVIYYFCCLFHSFSFPQAQLQFLTLALHDRAVAPAARKIISMYH